MNSLNPDIQQIILKATSASACQKIESIQSLWSGYGEIARYQLTGSKIATVIVKHVQLPQMHSSCASHPRGWNTDRSHQRKIKSYQVESHFYRDYSALCNASRSNNSNSSCRVPTCYGLEAKDDQFIMVMEDLDANGFSERITEANLHHMKACLGWLGHFHARFMQHSIAPDNQPKPFKPEGLWPIGSYWHLDTRPDELAALEDIPLKNAAHKIDHLLNDCPFQTLVHGDAKLANFCFSEDGHEVTAVDFQYVGGGCGMKDVAYFIGSCLHEDDCEALEEELLNTYFTALSNALKVHQPEINASAVEQAWRPLYDVAWTDFHRFVKGWSPDHWKIHSYSERLAQRVIERL